MPLTGFSNLQGISLGSCLNPMTRVQLQAVCSCLPVGKRLPGACYLARETIDHLPPQLKELIEHLSNEIGDKVAFNVLKISWADFAVSFLDYEDFQTVAHPLLGESVRVCLATGKVRRTNFVEHINRPILHRKETLLPPDHPDVPKLRALTNAEEQAGLFDESKTIGFEQNWKRLLEKKGLKIQGLDFLRAECPPEKNGEFRGPKIPRHKTALIRSDLSKPVKSLLERGLLKPGKTFFDYGCGHGTDIEGLKALGYQAAGWDPVLRANAEMCQADVVNLGYVLNVIEDPAERIETLTKAWSLSGDLLAVSVLVRGNEDYDYTRTFRDGVITKRGTFQKFFEQEEAIGLIESSLEVEPVPTGLGTFIAFRDARQRQDFLRNRRIRAIDWEELTQRIGRVLPSTAHLKSQAVFNANRDVLEAFWTKMIELGRAPTREEFPEWDQLKSNIGSLKKAVSLLSSVFGSDVFTEARRQRRDDLLVFLASCHFQKRIRWSDFSDSLQTDIKSFFGDFKSALVEAREILFSAGDPDEIELACEELRLGWQDEQALYFHRSLLLKLPVVLRVYVDCACRLYGDPQEADVLKLHKRSGKLTLLHYEDFRGARYPRLLTRVKVALRNQFVQVFEHSNDPDPQLLVCKQRFTGSPLTSDETPVDQIAVEASSSFTSEELRVGVRRSKLGITMEGAIDDPS
jgi:DNA phosphorothioation-associated putative methyltransferase